MQKVFVVTWINERLKDSGVLGVYATQQQAVAAVEADDSYPEQPAPVIWNQGKTSGYRAVEDHEYFIEETDYYAGKKRPSRRLTVKGSAKVLRALEDTITFDMDYFINLLCDSYGMTRANARKAADSLEIVANV